MEQPPDPDATLPGSSEDAPEIPVAPTPRRGAELRTFLIADIRGYTAYTEERGDEAAATLAGDFATLVEQVAGEFEGVLLEVRGDEALVVFFSARQALRAAVELQARAGGLARPMGIGLDAGEAIPVGTGYRGTALNVAARLCAQAKGGEIVASEAVIHMAARIDGVAYIDARTVRLKGLEESVRAVTVLSESKAPRGFRRSGRRARTRLTDRRLVIPVTGTAIVASVLVAVLALGALGDGSFRGPSPAPSTAAASQGPVDIAVAGPALALISAVDGTTKAEVPTRSPGEQAIFADGAFWQVETAPPGILKIDPSSGQVLLPVAVDVRAPGGFTLDQGTIWITDHSGPRVGRIDATTGSAQETLRLTSDPNDTRGATDVVAAEGFLWVTRPYPGEVIRIDPATGRVDRIIKISGANALALDGERLWVLSGDGALHIIDAPSGDVVEGVVRLPLDDYQSLVVGGGAAWTAGREKGIVYRAADLSQTATPYPSGGGATSVSFADGTLWVANQTDGTVTAIDAVTGVSRTYTTGRSVVGVVAGAGHVLVGVIPKVDVLAGLQGTTLRMALAGDPLSEFDPPTIGSWEMGVVADATCARLLRFPAKPSPDGWRLEPEVAADLPEISADGRTYTFRIREGFAFSTGEPLTAETFRASLERSVSGSFGQDFGFANEFLKSVRGVNEYGDGRSDHVEGLTADGDQLTITLRSRQPDFLDVLAMPNYCPVPLGTPVVEGGVNPPTGIASAGPYYLARKTSDVAVLMRNPHYAGSREAHYDNIVIELNQNLARAVAEVDAGRLDYLLSYHEPVLRPDGEIDVAHGSGSADQRYFNTPNGQLWLLVLDHQWDALEDVAVRQAIGLAVDRPKLASLLGAVPADQLLPPNVRGYAPWDGVPIAGPDVAAAERLMNGRQIGVTLAYELWCEEACRAAGESIAENLATIGIDAEVISVEDLRESEWDVALTIHGWFHMDPTRYLDGLPLPGGLGAMDQEEIDLVQAMGFLTGDERVAAAVALAKRWAAETAFATPLAFGVSREYFSSSVGCQVHPPALQAVDLVELCPKGG